MQHFRSVRRAILLALSLLSACAASEPGGNARSTRAASSSPSGAFGNYLAGRYALAQADADAAASDLLRALAAAPGNQSLLQDAFIACVNAGRPEAVALARDLPDNQVAQILLGDEDAKAGNWAEAEARFHAMPRQGLTQLLQPLLVAWSLQGQGRTDNALAMLRPFIEGQRFRGIFALHAALIADQANRMDEAARLYGIAKAEMPDLNLRLGQILASWQARTGQPREAQKTLAALSAAAPDTAIALPALIATSTARVIPRPVDGIAEAYLALAAALRAQDQGDFATLMINLALRLRPDFTAARLLAAEIQAARKHNEVALQILNQIPVNDPLAPMVGLRRALVEERLGRIEAAQNDLATLSQRYPDSPLPDLELGDLLRSHFQYQDAIAAYDRGIARIRVPTRSDWSAFYSRGIAHERARQWQKAEADFHRALELAPDQPFVLNYLGYSWADMGRNLDRARQMIEKAAERRPNDGAITDSLGWVLFRQGAIKEAVKTLERAVELDPEDATINGHLGDAYWASGRRIEAQYQWRRALTLNPAPDDAAKLEAKLSPIRPGPVVSGP